MVTNRLPFSAIRAHDNSWVLKESSGGLVTAISGLKKFKISWIGWAGLDVPDSSGQESLAKAISDEIGKNSCMLKLDSCIPVFLEKEVADRYYNGFCNDILWPTFHYINEGRLATLPDFGILFDAYKCANERFAEVVQQHCKDGDIIWCHDYHLMFLPCYLRRYSNQVRIAWFLHTPFPAYEVYRTLPARSELLSALLCCDLLGFHTPDYLDHFRDTCARILELELDDNGASYNGRSIRMKAIPVGIDWERFDRAREDNDVKSKIAELKEMIGGRKVVLGVDRLDMIKGIPEKLLAFKKFLQDHKYWQEKVVLVQIAVLTRTEVPE